MSKVYELSNHEAQLLIDVLVEIEDPDNPNEELREIEQRLLDTLYE